MLQELTVPALVIRGSESDMFAAETLPKVRAANPRVTALELQGSHDLANDNPDGLVDGCPEILAAERRRTQRHVRELINV